jgi:hypothetical protein
MGKRIWYFIYGTGQYGDSILLAKVKSEGLSYIVANSLREHYKDVKIK